MAFVRDPSTSFRPLYPFTSLRMTSRMKKMYLNSLLGPQRVMLKPRYFHGWAELQDGAYFNG